MGFGKPLDADRIITVDKDGVPEKKTALGNGSTAALQLMV
jgi:hypothetical protein